VPFVDTSPSGWIASDSRRLRDFCRGSLAISDRNAIDDFGKFNTACLAKRTLADNMSAETFCQMPTSHVLFNYGIENRLLSKTGSKRDNRCNRFSAEPITVHRFLKPYPDLRLRRVDMVQTSHSKKFMTGCETYNKQHIGPCYHHRKPGPPNLLKVFQRRCWVPCHIAGQCYAACESGASFGSNALKMRRFVRNDVEERSTATSKYGYPFPQVDPS
jgi:hypothetical protein